MDLTLAGITDVILVFMCVHYVMFFASLLFKKNRESIKGMNTELDELRHKPNKTLEEQKRFIELKYPKKEPFKWKNFWNFKNILKFIWSLVKYMVTIIFFFWVISLVTVPLWAALLIIFVLPHIISKILKKAGIQDKNIIVDLFGVK
tara:strand:- start:154 stop:594 length:441 start_codon:yes stop_codon:yes gene_type:complete